MPRRPRPIRSPRLAACGVLAGCTLALTPTTANAHAAQCSKSNAHYQDIHKLKSVVLQPALPGVRCSTAGPRVFVFTLAGPCRTLFQTVYVQKETNILGFHWSASYRSSRLLAYGWNRCKPR